MKFKSSSKSFALCGLLLAASVAQASDALYFFNPRNRIGCGTITAVRNVNQAPLYDREYEQLVGGSGSTGSLAVAVSGLGIVTQTAAALASLAVDATRDTSSAVDSVKAPESGFWDNIKAVRVAMDDGSVMNLPLTAQPKLSTAPKYEEGRRVSVYLLKERNSIQLNLIGKAPAPGEKLHEAYCSRRTTAEEAAAALKEKAALVQEDKIVD